MQKKRNSAAGCARIVMAIGIATLTACAQFETQHDTGKASSRTKDTGEEFGENRGSQPGNAPAVPQPAEREEIRVAVILGPGGYKAFAHAGVIKELKRRNIPINAVAGLEWGSLVAGLFAQRGQINEAEWKLYKLEKLDLNNTSFFSSKKEANSLKILNGFFRENLNLRDVGQSAVPFFCPSLSLTQGTIIWQDRGPLARAVSNCLAYPPLFTSESLIMAGLFSYDEIISRFKREGYNVIILVNVLGDGPMFEAKFMKEDNATSLLWSEARRALWRAKSLVTDVIDVNTRGVMLSDFESRKLLVTAGEAAGERAAKQLVTKYGF